jgi:hypothetical protein
MGSLKKIFIKKCFLFTVGSVCHNKEVHNWVKKFSQKHSKVADDTRPGHPVEIATEQLCSGSKS